LKHALQRTVSNVSALAGASSAMNACAIMPV
jgi:hypothetical protein